jgi:hypothetical protein
MKRRSLLLGTVAAVLLPKTAIAKLPAFDPGQYAIPPHPLGGSWANELWNFAPQIKGLTPEQVEQRYGIPARIVKEHNASQEFWAAFVRCDAYNE